MNHISLSAANAGVTAKKKRFTGADFCAKFSNTSREIGSFTLPTKTFSGFKRALTR
jgi:hypothetical protein